MHFALKNTGILTFYQGVKPSMTRHKPQSPQNRTKSQQAGAVRIISGRWRGRKLPVHDVEGLRPTTDRVKETLFNWIASDVPQSRCLDLFAGSGGLSFEALSRGADHVTLCEFDAKAAKQLQENLQQLGATNATLHHTDALTWLNTPPQMPFDLVFIDPPFRRDWLPTIIEKLQQNGWLAPYAVIYIETENELGTLPTPNTWALHREKTAGQVCYRLFIKDEDA